MDFVQFSYMIDTKEAALFLESGNTHIWTNDIQDKPIIYALDVENIFPSVTQELAFPAIAAALKKNGIKKKEISRVQYTQVWFFL